MTDIFQDDVDFIYAEAAELMPNVATYGGKDYQCWPAQAAVDLAAELDGDPRTIAATLKFRAADFTAPPVEGQLAKYKGKTYRILRFSESADGLQYTLTLGDERK